MKTVIRIGSRESRLAVTQTEIIKGQIEAHFPHIRVEIVTMKTTGDRILDRSLEQIGGKGLFVKELDQALRKGRVDLSVHSLKDMPMDIPEDLPGCPSACLLSCAQTDRPVPFAKPDPAP